MSVIMDGLLVTGSLFAGVYCWILAGRVRDLKNLDDGLGAAIVTLTRQIELARTTLEEARSGAKKDSDELERLINQADGASGRLKQLLNAVREPEARAVRRAAVERHRDATDERLAARTRPAAPEMPKTEPQPERAAAPRVPEPVAAAEPVAARAVPPEPDMRAERKAPVRPSAPPVEARAPERGSLRIPAAEEESREDRRANTSSARNPSQDVPKPRFHLAPSSLLRRAAPKSEPRDEAELLEALATLAAGPGR